MTQRDINMKDQKQIRLNKYLAECGVCSRREADKLIAEGRVTINGKTAPLGASVHDGVEIAVNGKPVQRRESHVVLAYYKPLGVTCTEKDRHAETTITDALQYPVRVTYAGRLDKDSEGLILMTNDGNLIHAMMQGANRHEKEYFVKVNKEVDGMHLRTMEDGMYLEELEQRTRPCLIEQVGKYTYRVVLTQGLNRQIRRMFHQLGYHVVGIRRVRVLNIMLGGLKPGEYRIVEGEELAALYRQAGLTRDNGEDSQRAWSAQGQGVDSRNEQDRRSRSVDGRNVQDRRIRSGDSRNAQDRRDRSVDSRNAQNWGRRSGGR